jgi:crotonobetainyl-CoA:carnitine CoA-transferase CaiB-like acyl-CoA transferase
MVGTQGALAGLVVIERAGRIATAACASLLASLGARVLRAELPDEDQRLSRMTFAERLLRTGGKERVQLVPGTGGFEADWRRLQAAADVLVFDPPQADEPDHRILHSFLAAAAGTQVICAISPAGLHGDDLPVAASDPLVQAAGGLMAVTGLQDGRPEFVRVPVAELSAAVIAVTSILAALRVRNRDGIGQLIDLSLIEVMADQLRTHLPMVVAGNAREFRIGCRHPICCPWNVFHARDGWVLICSASDVQWQGILDVIGRVELKNDSRFATAASRVKHADQVDAIVHEWVGKHSIGEVVAAISAINVPAGPALSIPQVIADASLRESGTVHQFDRESGGTVFAARNALRLGRTPPRQAVAPASAAGEIPPDLAARPRGPRSVSNARMPLQGVRVIEISRYAAGPLAGFVLASLGAEVIKVESPGGEDCRGWAPRFGGVSGYFANYNAGKRSIVLDLRHASARERLWALISSADVVLQNLRPDVMERMGFGADKVTSRHTRVVCATISGYGPDGPKLAALDTVMQGRLGLTALIGDGRVPLRVGYSIADQLAGHFAAAGILAALAEREHSGCGQVVDIAMADAMAWLTQLAWPDGRSAVVPTSQWETRDGWVLVSAERASVMRVLGAAASTSMTRLDLIRNLAGHGITAAPVLEADEVIAQSVIRTRRSLHNVATAGGAAASIFVAPLGLTLTPVLRPERMSALDEDNAALLAETAGNPAMRAWPEQFFSQ